MGIRRPKKLMLFGIDAASPELTQMFIDEGSLLNIEKIMKRGVFCENALPAYPTLTPSNWTTIVTGSWPGTHGITDFTLHHPGDPLDITHYAFSTDENSAEYLWNAAAKIGKRSVLMKYSASWPPKLNNGVQIDGCAPNCHHIICPDHLFIGEKKPSPQSLKENSALNSDKNSNKKLTQDAILWNQRKKDIYKKIPSHIPLYQAEGWKGITTPDPLTSSITLSPFIGNSLGFFLLIENRNGRGYDTISICTDRYIKTKVGEMTQNKWSDWVPVSFGEGHLYEGKTRFKLLELSPDGNRLRIYSTPVMPKAGYSQPETLAIELAETIDGAFIQGPPTAAQENNWIDPQTFCEVVSMQADWYAAASVYLLKKEKWDLFFIQNHGVDHAEHLWINKADPHTASSKKESEEYLGYIRQVYQAADRVIGKIVDELADEDTLIVVISDHGAKCYETQIFPEPTWERALPAKKILETVGLCTFIKDPETGEEKVDWSKTKAIPAQDCHVYVNLKGRDPHGIVEPGEEYNRVVEQVIKALRTYIDPQLDLPPFSLVLKREDARFLGHYTERSGDVIYAVDERYAYIHGQQLPACKLGLSSLRFLLIMAGHGLKKNFRLNRNVNLVDVCPTICHLMKLPIPKNCEGAIIYQAFEDTNSLL